MRKIKAAGIALVSLSIGCAAFAADTASDPLIPTVLPNPLKKEPVTPINYAEHLGKMEQLLYGEANEGKTDAGRMAALERTVFGASSGNPKLKLTMKTRLEGLARVVTNLMESRRLCETKNWTAAKPALEETIRLMGKDYKSTAKAEAYYRLGMCDYELSNIATASPKDTTHKVNGALVRSAKDNLTKAQDYYKSLGQEETSQKIAAFIDTFRDKAEMHFLF